MKHIRHYPKDYEFERLSMCCGAREHSDVPDICAACLDFTGFELLDEDGDLVSESDDIPVIPEYFSQLN